MLVNPIDVADGVLVNVFWAVGQMAARPRTSRRTSANLDIASWADTERLIRECLPEVALELPGLTDADATELNVVLMRDEVQGALQGLLAVRLTDAPERAAARARHAVRLALGGPAAELPIALGNSAAESPSRRPFWVTHRKSAAESGEQDASELKSAGAKYAGQLSEYFDDKISALVANLEGRVGFAGLAQVRTEAYNRRIVSLLGSIERQVAALADGRRGDRAETEFLERYRRQVRARHGYLIPPDFDRRRRVPVRDIYVPTVIREDDGHPEWRRSASGAEALVLNVWDLGRRLGRTVLLGDPGGGKTTAANVLTDSFAGDATSKIPFLITLRDYAAKRPERSVVRYIEQNLETLYQCPAPVPEGLVERLLLTGCAVVIFDGLDELLDASRRRDVTDRVEQFCWAYPLTPVLVTSRVVGYDQARLDDSLFTCYRLSGFDDDKITEYVGKWFGSQEDAPPDEAAATAAAFLVESANAADLRANPLLLSLMCILYRGAGSLPGDRAGIYARCAELLLRKWDEQRDLYRKLRADYLVEPTIRHLAWRLFTSEDTRAAISESDLINETTRFLYFRGFEDEDEARSAATEFVDFCCGRMWVFSDAGTTAQGEKLYSFTHRTFLEYFTAGYLAANSDTPEDLARKLVPHMKSKSEAWNIVAELAIKIKSDASDLAADRIYASTLNWAVFGDRDPLLAALVRSLASARPSPAVVRALTRAVLDSVLGDNPTSESDDSLRLLLANGNDYRQLVADEMRIRIVRMVAAGTGTDRSAALLFALQVGANEANNFWRKWSMEQAGLYKEEIAAEATRSIPLRKAAASAGIISQQQALAMPGGLSG